MLQNLKTDLSTSAGFYTLVTYVLLNNKMLSFTTLNIKSLLVSGQ